MTVLLLGAGILNIFLIAHPHPHPTLQIAWFYFKTVGFITVIQSFIHSFALQGMKSKKKKPRIPSEIVLLNCVNATAMLCHTMAMPLLRYCIVWTPLETLFLFISVLFAVVFYILFLYFFLVFLFALFSFHFRFIFSLFLFLFLILKHFLRVEFYAFSVLIIVCYAANFQ